MAKLLQLLVVGISIPAGYLLYRKVKERKAKSLAEKFDNSFRMSDLEEFTVVIGPISTITFYQDLPVEKVVDRCRLLLEYNPWLCSRLFQFNSQIEFRYSTTNNPSDYISVFESELDISCNPIKFSKYCKLKAGMHSINDNSRLFQIDIIKLKDGYALMQSICHSLGDGDTHYKIYQLLDSGLPMRSYLPNRAHGKNQLIPVFGAAKGPFAKWLSDRFVFRVLNPLNNPTHILKVNLKEIKKMKGLKELKHGQPFISTNDILASWVYKVSGAVIGACMFNLRGKLEGVHEHMVGNYFTEMCYTQDSYQLPGQIRKSITKQQSQPYYFKDTNTPFPDYSTLCDPNYRLTSFTNWSTFYHHLVIDGNEPIYHCPLLDPVTPDTHVVVFKPNKDDIYLHSCGIDMLEILNSDLVELINW
ncbi:hypothetical protein HDV06_006233 [Boothiomyces sp. JEL0866]|nr:hypothetical protein HDV06_006233 [Boothiomyces sp. JEL0866]